MRSSKQYCAAPGAFHPEIDHHLLGSRIYLPHQWDLNGFLSPIILLVNAQCIDPEVTDII